MPSIVRIGDTSTGPSAEGAGWASTAATVANNSTVFVNGKLAVTQGGSFATHKKGSVTHYENVQRKIVGGSSTVFIEGKPAARVGDAVADGDTCGTGSPDVFVG